MPSQPSQNWKMMQFKADLANDKTFYEKVLADDGPGATAEAPGSRKPTIENDGATRNTTKRNSEKISDLKVRPSATRPWRLQGHVRCDV